MKVILFPLLSFMFLLFAPCIMLAYSCAPVVIGQSETQRMEVAYEKAGAVFSGKVLKIEVRESSDNNPNSLIQVTFKVLETWKGANTKQVIITNNRYGNDFKIGKSYLVYAYYWDNNHLETNQCTRTSELTKAERDLKFLGKGKISIKPKT